MPSCAGDEVELLQPDPRARLAQRLDQRVVLRQRVGQLHEPSHHVGPDGHDPAGDGLEGVGVEEGRVPLHLEALHPRRARRWVIGDLKPDRPPLPQLRGSSFGSRRSNRGATRRAARRGASRAGRSRSRPRGAPRSRESGTLVGVADERDRGAEARARAPGRARRCRCERPNGPSTSCVSTTAQPVAVRPPGRARRSGRRDASSAARTCSANVTKRSSTGQRSGPAAPSRLTTPRRSSARARPAAAAGPGSRGGATASSVKWPGPNWPSSSTASPRPASPDSASARCAASGSTPPAARAASTTASRLERLHAQQPDDRVVGQHSAHHVSRLRSATRRAPDPVVHEAPAEGERTSRAMLRVLLGLRRAHGCGDDQGGKGAWCGSSREAGVTGAPGPSSSSRTPPCPRTGG